MPQNVEVTARCAAAAPSVPRVTPLATATSATSLWFKPQMALGRWRPRRAKVRINGPLQFTDIPAQGEYFWHQIEIEIFRSDSDTDTGNK